MLVFTARNVNEAYNDILWRLGITEFTEETTTRNGKVRRFNCPVTTVYALPMERVLWDEQRDANPFFHLMEAAWMLAGRNDVKFVEYFAKQMREYSDNGDTFHGAYGHRWRKHFKMDQVQWVIDHLARNPFSRRAVIGMWDPHVDPYAVETGGKDVPCNTQAYFTLRNGGLDMLVTNRSNDIIWGAYGANAVHFSYLHELVARSIGVAVGKYWQVSNDFHIYEQHWPLIGKRPVMGEDLYSTDGVEHTPLLLPDERPVDFTYDLAKWLRDPELRPTRSYHWIVNVAYPIYMAWACRKDGDKVASAVWLSECADAAWRLACQRWILRRDL